ncbi:isocitrate dehydrogenase (NAD(+)) idh1 [Phlyctochytrium planicorne]|nr:isocitrate dehydrogenase (NAD(+)) idh1 [Phlyctochytrium planicorne]
MQLEASLEGKPPPTFSDSQFVTSEEQQRFCLFYETRIVAYCRVYKFDQDGTVQATAITFFKRFYITNTVMDYDPKLILLTCLFLAAKVENSHMPLVDFLAKVPKAPAPEVILELEFVVCKGLEFQFMVQSVKWPLHGLFLDMQAYLLSKHPNSNTPGLRQDLSRLADTYAKAMEISVATLHTDLCLTYWPSQIAMGCFLVAAEKVQTAGGSGGTFRDEVERYITFRLGDRSSTARKRTAGDLEGSGSAATAAVGGGGFIVDDLAMGGEDGGEFMIELKLMLSEVVDIVSLASTTAASAAADKDEAKRIDVKLQKCRNPELLKDSKVYALRLQEEADEKERKRQKKLQQQRDKMNGGHGEESVKKGKISPNIYAGRRTVTLIPGDGIGHEMAQAVKTIFKAAQVPIEWEQFDLSGYTARDELLLRQAMDSIRRNKVALKGILYTPVGRLGHTSLNVFLRKDLDIFASLSLIQNMKGNWTTRHKNVDIAIIRENTEGEYSGLEHAPVPGVVESLKVVTRAKTERIARFAFDFALKNGRKKVTAIHKANIMKLGDGLFLKTCRDIAKEYESSGIKFDDMIVDNASMQLVSKPTQFDVIVCGNLYGNILSNIGAALVGGPGIVPGANIGREYAVFEPGCRHVGADLQGRNRANPTSLLLSAIHMLRTLGLEDEATRISQALLKVLKEGKSLTPDLGGNHTTTDFTFEVISNL